jgi:fibronectin-binding autotransporter adhesin
MKIRTIITVGLLASTSILSAQTYTWNGSTTGGAAGASDIWDTGTANWTGAGTTWPSSGTANEAVFDGTAGTVTVEAGGVTANKLTFNTTGYTISGGNLTMNGTTPTFAIGSDSAIINSVIAGSGGLTKTGAGMLTLTSLNTYSGGTNIDAGTLILGGSNHSNALGTGAVTINSGATLQTNGNSQLGLNNAASPSAVIVNGGTISAANFLQFRSLVMTDGSMNAAAGGWVSGDDVTINASTSTGSSITGNVPFYLRFDSNGSVSGTKTFDVARGTAASDLTISSILVNANTGVDSGIHKTGSGIMTLTRANTYSGGTTIDAGTLILGGSNHINTLGTGAVTINSGATLQTNGFSQLGVNVAGASPSAVIVNGGTISAANFLQFRSLVMTDGSMNAAAGGWVSGDDVTINASTSTGSFITGNFPFYLRFDSNGSVSGTKTFDVARGTAASDLTISSNLVNANTGVDSGIHKAGSGIMTLTGANTYSGGTTIDAGTLILGGSDHINALGTGAVTINSGATLQTNGFNRLGLNVAGASPSAVIVNGGTISAANFLQFRSLVMTDGSMNAAAGGWVSGDDVTINASTSTGSFITGNVPFYLRVESTGDVSGTKTFDVARGTAASDLTISSNLVNAKTGVVSGIHKTGSGIMTLTGANTYSGGTTIDAGTLLVNGQLTNSSVTVNSGTLGGTGQIDQVATIAADAFVAPGTAGVGTLSLQTASLAGTYQCEVGSSSADQLEVIGTLTVIPGATVAFTAIDTPTQAEYLIATYDILDGSLPAFTGVPTGYAVDTGTPGEIKLVQTGGGGFSSWADSWTSPSLSDKTPGGDPDNDGISNLLEYVLGGDPRVSDTEILPKQKIEAGFLVLSYKRSDASEGDTQQSGQWSTDLVNWNSIVPVLVSENGAEADDMEIRIPLSNAVNGKLFGRLQVSQ